MSLRIACNSCHRTFPARSRPHSGRCGACEESHLPQFIGSGPTVVVLETPAEAWE